MIKCCLVCILLPFLFGNCISRSDKDPHRELSASQMIISDISENKTVRSDEQIQRDESIEYPDLSDFYGKYTLTINSDDDDWRNMKYITLSITGPDSIFFYAEGYQVAQEYKLKLTELKDDRLRLFYDHAVNDHTIGGGTATLEKTEDFGTITLSGREYTWNCPYLDLWCSDGEDTEVYKLEKAD